MSGIVGVFHRDGAPVDQTLLGQLTEFLAFRGPDEQRTWMDGPVGFGHALLRTTEESENEHQPFSLDDRFWIVADARVDAREELIAKLEANGEVTTTGVVDAELILRAYRVWDERCVDHLLGDFVFAIWDKNRHSLFCARDQLGVKPCYYSQVGSTVVFSNTLDCIRQHPVVSANLNELALADFLMFDMNQEESSTCFADIQRLPSAHYVKWSPDMVRRKKYWTLPIEGPSNFKRAEDYTEGLVDLLKQAVGDRLRTNRVGVFMSGGLDSPALAATALELLRTRYRSFALQAVTSVYDELIPQSEREPAGLVASHLNIPIYYDVRDDETSIRNWHDVSVHTPEPVANPMAFAASVEFSMKIGSYARVFFYGEGPDNSLKYEWQSYISHLSSNRQWSRLIFDLTNTAVTQRRLPLLTGLLRKFWERNPRKQWDQSFPVWLDENFISRFHLRERWAETQKSSNSPHPIRPKSYEAMTSPLWQGLFEDCDLTSAWGHSEVRHPFLDLRLLRFLLAVPAIPWCRNKYILRESMRKILPPAILERKKQSIPVNPDFVRVRASGFPAVLPTPEFLKYVNLAKVPSVPQSAVEFRGSLRALSLEYWLRNLKNRKLIPRGIVHEHTTTAQC